MERNLTHIALFAALIAALGLVPKIDLASGVPITAQTMGVMLCGTVLGARRGALAALLFVALVATGLPLLAGGRGGLGVFASPTAGYVIGFAPAAFVTGWVVERWRADIGIAAFAGALIGGI
ncbi:MAG: biotin transporter BioY, partial [Gemmobacter sp.]|nr:biotin transporter BioY [Gemmobacter sp.]